MNHVIKQLLFGGRGAGSLAGDVGLAILRIGVGSYLAFAHGMGKVFHNGTFGPTEQLINGTAALGFPMPTFFAWCAAFAEFFGAILLALGLFTRPMALILAFNMSVAAFLAHASGPWTGEGSREPAMMYLLPFVMFLFTGAGHFSIDAMIRPAGSDRRGSAI